MNFEYRQAKREAVCHCCDKWIDKGEYMVTGYSSRQRGMNMHFHPDCLKQMYGLMILGEN